MENLFVYGTLQFPQIVKRLTGKAFKAVPARLPGYKRYLVKGCDYPAVVEKQENEVLGLLLKDVDDQSFQQLKLFEGEEYVPQKVEVYCAGKKTEAVTFIWINDVQLLEEEDWDQEKFEKESLKNYS